MKSSEWPLAFWDYYVERRARINNLTAARNLFQLQDQTPSQTIHGVEGNISNLCQFDWYQWVYFCDQTENFSLNKEVFGKVLSPASGEGNEMAQWVLKSNGKVVPRRTVRPLTPDKISSEVEKAKRDLFDEIIKKRWGDSVTPPPNVKPDDDEDEFVE